MKAKELADELLRRIAAGTLDPNAIVVRPLCSCDEDVGLVEAAHVDQVERAFAAAPNVGVGGRVFRYGDFDPSAGSAITVKLG